jgi:hypothetical protein
MLSPQRRCVAPAICNTLFIISHINTNHLLLYPSHKANTPTGLTWDKQTQKFKGGEGGDDDAPSSSDEEDNSEDDAFVERMRQKYVLTKPAATAKPTATKKPAVKSATKKPAAKISTEKSTTTKKPAVKPTTTKKPSRAKTPAKIKVKKPVKKQKRAPL